MFKVLLGLQGTNTRTRFLVINSVAWALLFILCIFIDESLVFYALILIPALALYACVIRVSDKRPPEPLYYLLPLAFVLGALACGLLSPMWALLPLVLSLPLWVQLARMAFTFSGCEECSSRGLLKEGLTKRVQRVEPTFGSGINIEDFHSCNEVTENQAQEHIITNDSDSQYAKAHPFFHIFDDLKDNIRAQPKLYLIAVIAAAIVLLMIILRSWLSHPNNLTTDLVTSAAQPQQQEQAKIRHEARLPDNFALILEGNKLALSWAGDKGEATEIWSQANAKGDRSCSELVFNDSSVYRPIRVLIAKDNKTQAWFSPLDTKNIIKGIAKYSSAKLCGYHFSLKGTQALLEEHHVFAAYLK